MRLAKKRRLPADNFKLDHAVELKTHIISVSFA